MPNLTNPSGAFGQAVGAGNQGAITIPFLSAETTTTIAKGNCVSMNATGGVLQSTTTVDVDLCIGIACEAIAPGKTGLVALLGKVTAVTAQGAIAAGAVVIRSGTTAGAVADGAAATAGILGVAIAAAAGNLVDVFVKLS